MNDKTEVSEILKVFGERLNHEHVLIANRMAWLMALNGFLVAALGVVIANANRIPQSSLAVILISTACLGALSNASCLYSNYWGSRALSEATRALHVILEEYADEELRKNTWRSLRLYGRDPDNPPLPFSIRRPPSKILHPWFLLPALFGIAFILAPFSGINSVVSTGANSSSATIQTLPALLPLVITAIVFLPPILIEKRWRRLTRARNISQQQAPESEQIAPLMSSEVKHEQTAFREENGDSSASLGQ